MATWLLIDFLSFLFVLLLTGVLIPQILLIAFRKQLFDIPDERKVHHIAVPRLGGIAFFPSILVAMSLVSGILRKFDPQYLDLISGNSVTTICFLISSIVILYLVGIADDLVGLKYRAKFCAQILSAVLIIVGGLQLETLHGFLFIEGLPAWSSVMLTVLLTVFITNAMNLIDGIDGLASGLSAIACAFFGTVFLSAGLYFYSMIAFCTLGTLIPFFYYNVFGDARKHAKIFMGDTGALTVGLLLSVMSIRICDIPDPMFGINPAVLAFSPLMIPCCDVVRVYFRRLRAHRNPFLPDKTHIHHKLLALGMSQRVAMPTIVLSSLLLTLLNYALSSHVDITILFSLDIVIWIIANIALSRAIRRRTGGLALSGE